MHPAFKLLLFTAESCRWRLSRNSSFI